MAAARRRWSPDEKREIMRLYEEGYTHKQIAEKLRPGVKSAFRSVGDIIREERRRKSESVAQTETKPPPNTQPSAAPAFLPLTSSSKIVLPDSMNGSLSAKEFMQMMDDDQRRVFVSHYEDLRGEMDEESLTRAENEMLIRASYSNVKYLRAQSMLSLAENYLMADMQGGLSDSDEDKAKRRFAGRGDAYKKEAEQWHKEYMELLNDLKLTRKQRLDKIKDTRNTLLDIQNELTSKIRRESIVEDIKRINMATKEEFLRMARGEAGPDGNVHSWLIGAFDEYVGSPTTTTPPEHLENTGDQNE